MSLVVRRVVVLGVLGLMVLGWAQPATAADYTKYLASPVVCPNQLDTGLAKAAKIKAIRCLLNEARKERGLRRVSWNRKLDRAAALKLRDNVRCDEFSHTACGKPFISVFNRSGYVASATGSYSVGENLAWGQGVMGTPRSIVLAWLRSNGHRHNLFSSEWREGGVAYRFDAKFEGNSDVALWANTFGRR